MTDWLNIDEDNLTSEQKKDHEEKKREFYKSIAQSIREALDEKLQCDMEVS